jgi:hypothetical protein
MNVEQLVSLANARGVDLKHAAGAAIETKGISRQRQRQRQRQRTGLERELGVDVRETASGRQSRVHPRPAWTLAELAQARPPAA